MQEEADVVRKDKAPTEAPGTTSSKPDILHFLRTDHKPTVSFSLNLISIKFLPFVN